MVTLPQTRGRVLLSVALLAMAACQSQPPAPSTPPAAQASATATLALASATPSPSPTPIPGPVALTISAPGSASDQNRIYITFSSILDANTALDVSKYDVQRADGSPWSGVASVTCLPSQSTCTSVRLAPAIALDAGSYIVVISGVTDTAGRSMEPDPTRTSAIEYVLDPRQPRIISVAATRTSLVVTYSEAMKTTIVCGSTGRPGAAFGSAMDLLGNYRVLTPGPPGSALSAALMSADRASVSADCRAVTFRWARPVAPGVYELAVGQGVGSPSPQDASGFPLSRNPWPLRVTIRG